MAEFDWPPMRLSADWMTIADERILEYLRDNGPNSPKEISEDERMNWSRQYIGDRCRTLHGYGLLEKHGRGVYALTEKGRKYLEEELDAGDLEA